MIILNDGVFLAKEVAFLTKVDDLTKMITLRDDILRRLINEISLTRKVSAIALLMIIRYITIIITLIFVTIFAFEIIESRFLIYNKSNVFRVRKSYKI